MERADLHYLDFDLIIEPIGGDRYRARVVNSPAGRASTEFARPFSALQLENFRLRIGLPRPRLRQIGAPKIAAVKEMGGHLFESVFTDEVLACLRSSMEEAERQDRTGVRVRLQLGHDHWLTELPWEYLYDAKHNRFLSRSVKTPLVRYLEQPGLIRPLAVQPPLRVLVMISSPTDYDALDVEQEWRRLQNAVRKLERNDLIQLERLQQPTLQALMVELQRRQYHVFHFIGHGGFDTRTDEGVIVLETEDRRGHLVKAEALGTSLHDEDSLRLAILNACEGARGGIDPFGGTAQGLIQQGVPAVIAMQFAISDKAAVTFTDAFYTAVASGYPVDAALAEARKAIYFSDNEVEWGTPVLYMRSSDGHLFDIQRKDDVVLVDSPSLRERLRALPMPRGWKRYAAAAVLLIALVGGFARMFARPDPVPPPAITTELEIVGPLPAGAEVWANGTRVAGLIISLAPDRRHVVAVTAPGHVADSVIFSLGSGERRSWIPTLQALPPQPGTLQITGDLPPGARVLVDGNAVDGTSISLRPGQSYTVQITAPGYVTAASSFSLNSGEQRSWSPSLREAAPSSASLELVGELPPDARVLLDGVPVTGRVVSFTAGARHELRVIAAGYVTLDTAFTLQADERRVWTPQLRRVAEPQPGPQLATLLQSAQQALQAENWAQAVSLLQQALAADPGNSQAQALLTRARNQQELAQLYSTGRQHQQAGRLRSALDTFVRVREIGGSYLDVDQRIAGIRDALRAQDDADVRAVIARYARAIESRNLDQVLAVFPAMSATTQNELSEFFQVARNLRVQEAVTGVTLDNTSATVRATLTLRFTDKGGSKTVPDANRFTLVREGTVWRIRSVASDR